MSSESLSPYQQIEQIQDVAHLTLALKQGAIWSLVAHTGFEPVISSLRGRCPRPLDECATRAYGSKKGQKSTTSVQPVIRHRNWHHVRQ